MCTPLGSKQLSTHEDHETDPDVSEDPHPRREGKSCSVRGTLQRLQQNLHWRDKEDIEGQTGGAQAGSGKRSPRKWHCCSCP